jgi:hypothetical protein
VHKSQSSIKKEIRVRTNRSTYERCGLRHVDLLHTLSVVLDQLHVFPLFGGLSCPHLAISRSLWKGKGHPAGKEYVNDRRKIILFVFVVR